MSTVGSLHSKIIKTSYEFFVGIRKHIVVFIISMLLGALPFIWMYNSKKNLYESSFTVSYEELVRKIYGDRLMKIDAIVQQKDYDKVAYLLSVNKNVAKSLVSVKGMNILGEDLSKDMNTDRIPFIVHMVVRDSSTTGLLQKGIVNFLEEGSAYMVDKNKIRRKEISNEIEFIQQQLAVMDSLKRILNVGGGKNIQSINERESGGLAAIFQFSYELYKKKQDLIRKQEMMSTVLVVDDAIVAKSTKGSAPLYIIYSLVLGGIIYLIITGFILPVIRYKN